MRVRYSSIMQAPRIERSYEMGVGDGKQDSKVLEAAQEQLATIAGQKPNVRRARKSIANFKLREGMPVGLAVTLRDARAYEFLDRLLSVAIPRIRDFRGLKANAFDGRGNYSMGIREQIIFPEIDYDSIDQVRGLDVTIATTAQTDEEAFALLEAFGMPFEKETSDRSGAPGQAAAGGRALRKNTQTSRAARLEQLKAEDPEAYERPVESQRPTEEKPTSASLRSVHRRTTKWPRRPRVAKAARKYKPGEAVAAGRPARAVYRKFGCADLPARMATTDSCRA